MADSPIDPRWLKVYECGFTKHPGTRVTIKRKYYTEQGRPADTDGCCYLLPLGHFNLYDRHGHSHESDFRVGHVYEVMRVEPNADRIGETAYLRDVTVPPHIAMPDGL